jgi:hypothetical protein
VKTNLENINKTALSVVKVILKNQVVIFKTLECNAKKADTLNKNKPRNSLKIFSALFFPNFMAYIYRELYKGKKVRVLQCITF